MEYGLDNQSLIHDSGTGILLFTTTSEIALGFPQPPALQILKGNFSLGIRDNQTVMLIVHPNQFSKMKKHGTLPPCGQCSFRER
jgi:hypothetical protein